MATQSPFLWFEGFLQNLPLPDFQPPIWVIEEGQRRIVLLLNHVLSQEKEAASRLARQKGCVVLMQWRTLSIRLTTTAAGLLDLAPTEVKPDLVLAVTEQSPLALAREVLQGRRPAVRIAGDVQLAAEVNWLVDHVRWDLEEDLSRALGDAPAHALGQAAKAMTNALRQFNGATAATDPGKAST
jgi:ubiquinone biosynthesis protein UbiJ